MTYFTGNEKKKNQGAKMSKCIWSFGSIIHQSQVYSCFRWAEEIQLFIHLYPSFMIDVTSFKWNGLNLLRWVFYFIYRKPIAKAASEGERKLYHELSMLMTVYFINSFISIDFHMNFKDKKELVQCRWQNKSLFFKLRIISF